VIEETRDNSGQFGYGKPPNSGRFKKGQSGNPKGRPKGTQNLSTILKKVIYQKIVIREGGVEKTVTKFEAVAMQLTSKAAGGDVSAAREILKWAEAMERVTSQMILPPKLVVNFISPKPRRPDGSLEEGSR
jgi:hypothetical protein